MPPFTISSARTPDDLDDIKRLLSDYASWLNLDLTFQNWAEELASLPGKYAQPEGDILLARYTQTGEAFGCVAVRKITLDALDESGNEDDLKKYCEMKRLWVADTARGTGAGAALATAIVQRAKEMGYDYMVLDTLKGRMGSAVKLYKKLGFVPREKYYENPHEDVTYLQLDLKNPLTAHRSGPP